jgi:hypothetical protein
MPLGPGPGARPQRAGRHRRHPRDRPQGRAVGGHRRPRPGHRQRGHLVKLVDRHAQRMTIEQRLAEQIRSFHLDALSSVGAGRLRRRAPPPARLCHRPPPTPSGAALCPPAARSLSALPRSWPASPSAPTAPCCARPTCPRSKSPGGVGAGSTRASEVVGALEGRLRTPLRGEVPPSGLHSVNTQGRIVDQELTIWASVGRVIARARSVDDTWNRET